jgi:hypothetical protein
MNYLVNIMVIGSMVPVAYILSPHPSHPTPAKKG